MKSNGTRKVAFVTGSGKTRLGYYIASSAADRGYDVALHYNSSQLEADAAVQAFREKGVAARAFQANLENDEETLRLCESVKEHFGRVDLLVTSAAIWEETEFGDVTGADLRRHFSINTVATVLCCQEIGELMVQQEEGGSIITMGDWALDRPYLNHLAYFASKASIPLLTKVLANELSARNPAVRVNSINPGPAMIPEAVNEDEQSRIIERNLVKTLGSPKDIVEAVFFLTESQHVSGTSLTIDGGRTSLSR